MLIKIFKIMIQMLSYNHKMERHALKYQENLST